MNAGVAAAPPRSTRFLAASVVVMPALNEAACVGATVRAWLELGAARVRVVDNGSTDDTAAIARSAGAEVIAEPRRGYGAAAFRGLHDWPSGLPWVLFSSSDGSDRLDAGGLPAWQSAVDNGADLVVGDRVAFAASRAQLKPVQRFGNWVTCAALRAGWKVRFNDMGSLRLAQRDRLLALGVRDRGFGWNVEMQVRAVEQGWRILELPVHYHPRAAGESKISGNLIGTVQAGRGILRTLVFLWALRHAPPPAQLETPAAAAQGPLPES